MRDNHIFLLLQGETSTESNRQEFERKTVNKYYRELVYQIQFGFPDVRSLYTPPELGLRSVIAFVKHIIS